MVLDFFLDATLIILRISCQGYPPFEPEIYSATRLGRLGRSVVLVPSSTGYAAALCSLLCRRLLCCPTLLQCGHDVCPASFAQLPFRLGRFRRGGWRWRLRFAPNLRPSRLLRQCHPFSSGSGELLALADGRYRRGVSFSGTTGQHGPEFGDLGVYVFLLGLEPDNCSLNDRPVQFLCWHMTLPHSPSLHITGRAAMSPD